MRMEHGVLKMIKTCKHVKKRKRREARDKNCTSTYWHKITKPKLLVFVVQTEKVARENTASI